MVILSGTGDNLTTTAVSADANQAMVVNALYVVDMSGWTADRTFTLPTTAAVGDRVGVLVSVTSASFELLLTAGAGNTLNGVAGGSEWSRIFIQSEIIVMRCTVANSTWIVEQNGRIAQVGLLRLSTAASGEVAATFTQPTTKSGVWTADIDNASITTAASDQIKTRRKGNFHCAAGYRPVTAPADAKYLSLAITLNGTATFIRSLHFTTGAALQAHRFNLSQLVPLAIDDFIVYLYRTEQGSLGAYAAAAPGVDCSLSLREIF